MTRMFFIRAISAIRGYSLDEAMGSDPYYLQMIDTNCFSLRLFLPPLAQP